MISNKDNLLTTTYDSVLKQIITIQSCWRMYKCRDRYKIRLLSLAFFGIRQVAATTIQRYWRGYHTRKVLLQESTCLVVRYPACNCVGATTAAKERQYVSRNIETLFIETGNDPIDTTFTFCCTCCPLGAEMRAYKPENDYAECISDQCCRVKGCLTMMSTTDTEHQKLCAERLYNNFKQWSRNQEVNNSSHLNLTSPPSTDESTRDESPSSTKSLSITPYLRHSFARCFANLVQPTKPETLSLNYVRANLREECLYVGFEDQSRTQAEPAISSLGTCIRRPVCYFCGNRLASVTNTHEEISDESGEGLKKWLSAPKWMSTNLRVVGSFDSVPWRFAHPLHYCSLRKCLIFALSKEKINSQTSLAHDLGRQGFDPAIRAAYESAFSCLLSRVWRKIVWDTYMSTIYTKMKSGQRVTVQKQLEYKRSLLILYSQHLYPQLILGLEFKFVYQTDDRIEWLLNEHEYQTVINTLGQANNMVLLIS